MAYSPIVKQKLLQKDIYKLLQQRGSEWLKKHVVFADRQLVVLNKPPGVISQLGVSGTKKERESAATLDPVFRDIKNWIHIAHPHSVHRLDKATTGTLLVALNATAATALSRQFQQGTISKTYLALVRGGEKSFSAMSGEIKEPLAYVDGRGDIKRGGKEALTKWELVASSPKAPLSLLRLQLLTGNKHQLRIHLAKALKVPIVGDTSHSQTSLHPSIAALNIPEDRLFLHASEISLYKYHEHGPRYHLGIRAPLPSDFKRICHDAGIVIPLDERVPGLSISDKVVGDEVSELKLWEPKSVY
ncbi:pseudouridine synthase [Gymnopilus junonius]|uniref:21S rRNA pseudouridine(2819) synthase n=1 Tax=Gymnopilus junonius TaxID=109634 RepID=A0A9P5N7S5_GYMJU|nr:pseudouridine synthase [Gymnopilus junonius]